MRPSPSRLLLASHAAVLLAAGLAVPLLDRADAAPVTARAAVRPAPVVAFPLPVTPVVAAPVNAPEQPRRSVGRAPAASRRTAVPVPAAVAALGPQERGERALAALGFPWQRLGYRVVFRPYTGGLLGHANARARVVTVYVKPRQDEVELRTTIAHELGHVLDFVHGDDARRQEYRRLRGLPAGTAWFPCSDCEDLASPAGDWAEVFAASLVGTADFRSRLAGPPSAAQLRQLRQLFAVPEASRPRPATVEQDPAPAEDDEGEDEGLLPLLDRR